MKQRITSYLALAAGLLALTPSAMQAQKPKSQKEVEALQAIQTAKTPDAQVQAIENVLTKFADTEYKNLLLQMAMQIESQKGDYAQTLFYAERLLEADPKNAFAMVTISGETARHTREFDLDKEEKLAKVEKYAKEAIEASKTMPKTRADLTDEQWDGVRKDLQSQAYEALGMAAMVRKKVDDAISAYKQAIATAASQDPATLVRLGQAYMDAGKFDEANDVFDKAIATPNVNPTVKAVAEEKKAELAKRKAAKPPAGQH